MPRIAYEQGGSAQTALATPGATSTVLSASEYEVPEGAIAIVRWHVTMLNASGTAGASFVVTQTARRPAGGSAALVGSAAVDAQRDVALLLTGVAVEASGTKVRLKVTGLVATALSWWVSYEAEIGGAPLRERKRPWKRLPTTRARCAFS